MTCSQRAKLVTIALIVLTFGAGIAVSQTEGSPSEDIAFAKQLWQHMRWVNLVGPRGTRTMPFRGAGSHMAANEYLEQTLRVGWRTGLTLIKRNYDGEGLTIEQTFANRQAYLKTITIMFRREKGYDPKNADWFWAEYGPDGHVESAGRVEHCIACHARNADKDFRFLPAIEDVHPTPSPAAQ